MCGFSFYSASQPPAGYIPVTVTDSEYRFVRGFPNTPYFAQVPISSWLPSDRASDRVSERLSERSSEWAIEQSSERSSERSKERSSDRASDGTNDHEQVITRAPDGLLTRWLVRCEAFFKTHVSNTLPMHIYHQNWLQKTESKIIWNPTYVCCRNFENFEIKVWWFRWTLWRKST